MPVSAWPPDDDGTGLDIVVALATQRTEGDLLTALGPLTPGIVLKKLFDRAPIFWWQLHTQVPIRRAEVARCLSGAGALVRYVASAHRPNRAVTPRLRYVRELRCEASSWPVRSGKPRPDPEDAGYWFLRSESGVAVDRTRFGAGSGTRLAVIDDDVAGVDHLELDSEVLVNLEQPPRHTLHGAAMVALAVGARPSGMDLGFQGVAPYSSPRLYCIPKPEEDVVSLPLAMVRATSDGADVILCATFIEGMTSPMLDDALELAVSFGRKGRGTAVVFPVGRDASSPAGSTHASLSLALGDPASDPRAFAIGPSGREGGWFLWRDRRGRLRPFANRGPAVRWLAPGDDLAFPFKRTERLFHAESSGASAIAAGAILLVLAANPRLTRSELDAILTRTATPVRGDDFPSQGLADRRDVDPSSNDRDGHNAKHGYGRLHVTRACLAAADPVSAVLVAIGEEVAAQNYMAARVTNRFLRSAYSRAFARWAARALLFDETLLHGAKSLARHLRVVAKDPERQRAHGRGAFARQLAVLLQSASKNRGAPRPSQRVATELTDLARRVEATRNAESTGDETLYTVLAPLWPETS
jgi:hypothetical protein